MKTLNYAPENPKTYFTVTNNDINNSKALLPSVLYNEMQDFAHKIIANNPEIMKTPAKLYKLEVLTNAFLDDELVIESKIKKFNNTELQLTLIVKQNDTITATTICKAIFKFQFKKEILKAS